jgi:hypothetical protein
MVERLIRSAGNFLVLVAFTLLLPLFWAAARLWGSADERWLMKMALTFLAPFSAVLWFIAFRHLVLGRRAGYLMQLVVFIGTAAVIYLLLVNGVYRL